MSGHEHATASTLRHSPPIRAVPASSQASRAAGASAPWRGRMRRQWVRVESRRSGGGQVRVHGSSHAEVDERTISTLLDEVIQCASSDILRFANISLLEIGDSSFLLLHIHEVYSSMY